jgi:hypothetical protein
MGMDAGTPTDVPTSTDRGTATVDRLTTTDAGARDYGTCGMSLHTARCTCGNDTACQQTALSAAISRSTACQNCYSSATSGCCPTEVAALQTCAQDAGCMDSACVVAMCGSQLRAYDACLTTAQESNANCQRLFRGCLGADFPMIICDG